MNKVALVIALLWASAALWAKDPSTTVFKAVQIAPEDTKYSTTVQWGKTSFQALDWQIATVSGDPNIEVILLQSNSPDGPFTQWDDPLDGSGSITNAVTITSTSGGTPWRCTPSDWAQYRIRNLAAATATVTMRDYSY